MAIKDVESKCWILALFVRDDGERFLLGDGSYEFTEKQLHFAANTMANDVVEVQGNDGYLLAGQVRRPSTQTFDGYVGDSSTSKALVEERRRAFFAFFRKNFFYKVIYIFPDGSAIQRKRGFLVDAPEVKEIRQIYPEYHVALNFEDINYYYYDEDADGQEIYGKSATINLNSVAQSGGLIWLLPSEMTLTGEGTNFTLSGTVNGTALTSADLKGNTYQQTYSGKNLLYVPNGTNSSAGVDWTVTNDTITGSGTVSSSPSQIFAIRNLDTPFGPGTYTFSISQPISYSIRLLFREGTTGHNVGRIEAGQTSATFTTNWTTTSYDVHITGLSTGDSFSLTMPNKLQLESGDQKTAFEPYTGGIAAPNPDYPQEVQTATGRQVVTVSNGTESQEYEVNLGKNLFNLDQFYQNRSSIGVNVGSITITETTIQYIGNTSTESQFYYAQDGVNKSIYGMSNLRPNTTYTISYESTANTQCWVFFFNASDQRTQVQQLFAGGYTNMTFTTPADLSWYSVRIDNRAVGDNTISNIQIEKGSTATSYAPYFEPIELCKIGTYQDYIYKSGSDWYVHKEIGKQILDGSENFTKSGSTSGDIFSYTLQNGDRNGTTEVISNYFLYNSANVIPSSRKYNDIIYFVFSTYGTTDIAGFKVWLSTHNTVVYYILATPTDTQITNTALIAQLNALAAATTYNGSTNFTVDGNGNLAAILAVEVEAVGGGGVEWDENGAVWEEGKPSYSIISVDSIDNVYPVLTITGRTVNPVLTDVTTGTIFQYNGTITDSQVLRVDMMSKTATLNGVSVIGNVTGDWLYLAPGNNRITYTADNADAPNATVEWQEIVG